MVAFEASQTHVLSSEILDSQLVHWKGLNPSIVENFSYQRGKAVELEYRYYIAEEVECRVGGKCNQRILVYKVEPRGFRCHNGGRCLSGLQGLRCGKLILFTSYSLNMLYSEQTKLSIVGKQKLCMMNTSILKQC